MKTLYCIWREIWWKWCSNTNPRKSLHWLAVHNGCVEILSSQGNKTFKTIPK